MSEILHLPNQLWIVIKGSWWECSHCPLLVWHVHYAVPCLSSQRWAQIGRGGWEQFLRWSKMLTILTGKEAWSGREYYVLLTIRHLIGSPSFPANTSFSFYLLSAKIGLLYTHLFSWFWLIVFVFTAPFSPQASLILRHINCWLLPLLVTVFLFLSFNFFLLFMFYFPGIYLYCVHVCVLPNRAVKIYCVSVFLRRL